MRITCGEVVSPDRPERDLVDKRIDYAEAGIPEYWVVDPHSRLDQPAFSVDVSLWGGTRMATPSTA